MARLLLLIAVLCLCYVAEATQMVATCDDIIQSVQFDGTDQPAPDANVNKWDQASTYTVPAGTENIRVHCKNTGGAGGFLAELDNDIVTDGCWECSTEGFDSGMAPATVVGSNGDDVPQISSNATWIWTPNYKYNGGEGDVEVYCQKEIQIGTSAVNIRQCSWVDSDHRDEGPLATCTIDKDSDTSALRVAWYGSIRLQAAPPGSCSRWYFTINGEECQSPAPIDVLINLSGTEITRHRGSALEGLCGDIPAGLVTVTLNLGRCPDDDASDTGDAITGWGTTSRIILEEIPLRDPTHIA